ncbi:MAG: sigma-70 family RNA polymerase sigma factor [Bacteroidales bacterium]|jgi:RNA polymerase sigma-70 factor (ECF subfamily)|nr:sigma-70 family RNA polymerase sigma factor [Bacteroidales bacterium]
MEAKRIKQSGSYEIAHTDLIDACRKGDQKAQFRIYRLYYKSMYNISLRILNDPMEAEDIMQESFLAAFEKIGNYSGIVSFGAWLKSIVRNKSLDALRRSEKHSMVDIESCTDLQLPDEEEEKSSVETEIRYSKLIDHVKRLPKQWKNVFSLYFLEGYDHEEISKILSIEECTSRSQLSRARKKLLSDFKNQ